MKHCAGWLLLCFALGFGTSLQAHSSVSPSVPSTAPSSVGLSADFSRYYFKTPEDEVAARADLNVALVALDQFQGQINSAQRLLGALRQYDAVQKLYAKHDGYLHLRCAQNRKDTACEAENALEAEVDAKTAFLAPEILAIPDDRLNAFLNAEAGLAQYRFAISDIRRDAAHVLPGSDQALLDRFKPEIGDWQYDLYEQTVTGVSFGTVQTPSGPLDVVRQRNLIAANPDEHVREEGFKKRYAGYASQSRRRTFWRRRIATTTLPRGNMRACIASQRKRAKCSMRWPNTETLRSATKRFSFADFRGPERRPGLGIWRLPSKVS
jgi:hypothetical protein